MDRVRKPRIKFDRYLGILFISPWIIGVLFFKFLPILASFGISFTNFQLLTPEATQFIGFENYIRLFHDEGVGYVLFATISLGLTSIPFQLAASIAIAALLNNRGLKFGNLMRTLFFLPSIIPGVAIFFMWSGFVDPNTGWLNKILESVGLTGFNDLYSSGATSLLFGISALWSVGPGMLIMLGSLQGMPPEIQEAAQVDGAGPLVRFFYITLPLISPAIFFSIVINLISIFGGVILLDRGNGFSGGFSPYDSYVSYILFNERDLGYAASLAWFFLILVMIVVIALFSSARKWVYYPDREA
ncbi:MAG: sugar ABC transporter permease [Anaerolineales bacterium]|nr:sugar ABC transporter permease [Anaerolineales bacterium]